MTHTINIAVAFLLVIFFSSCSDTITNQYLQPEENGKAPEVNVIWSSYSLETVHSFHMDTTAYPEYNYCINLNLKLDNPENRNQINKMIIVNESGYGWEFFKTQLEEFYSDTLGGYELQNLIYRSYSSSQNYKVKLFSATNKKAEDYELFIIPNFLNSYISHGWYTQNIYQISLDYYYESNFFKKGKIVWLNESKQSIDEIEINSSFFVDNYRLRVNNVPADAFYFYIYIEGKRDGISLILKSAPYPIEERYPSNIQLLGENISNLNYVYMKYIPEIRKILIIDRSNYYLYVIDYTTFTLVKQFTFSSYPYSLAYSAFDNKIYIGCQNAKVYSLSLNDNSPSFVKSLTNNYIYSLIVIDKYLIASTGDYNLKVVDLEDYSSSTQSIDNRYYNLIFNATKKVVYASSEYGNILRFNFDPDLGLISDPRTVYTSGSDYSYLLLFPDDSKLITSGGYIYNCSSNTNTDLSAANNLGSVFSCAYFLNNNNSIATLSRPDYSSGSAINIYSASDYQLIGSAESFYGYPQFIIADGDVIKVIENYNNKMVAEEFTYSQLVSGNISLNKEFKEKYFLSKKFSY